MRFSQNLEEFCRVKLGKSYRRLQELSQNLNMLGSDLYESAEKIGFRAKDYRALKALPAEEQEVVKQALASEDKDEVLGILEDMVARHVAEKKAAKKEKEGLQADLAARDKLLGDRSAKLEKTEKELYRLKSLPPNEQMELALAREEEAVEQINAAHIRFLKESNSFFGVIAQVLETEGISIPTQDYAIDTARKVCQELADYMAHYGIDVHFEQMVSPEWLKEQAAHALKK